MHHDNQPGYYGKIPSKGDFVRHNVPQTFLQPWDDWLQHCLSRNKQILDEQWHDYFMITPVWYFALSPGICGEEAWLGFLFPSVDSVGRHFPFTVIAPLPSANLFSAIDTAYPWLDKNVDTALQILDTDNSTFELNTELSSLSDYFNQPNEHYLSPQKKLDFLPLKNSFFTLLERSLSLHCQPFSLWWTLGSSHIQPSLLITQALIEPHTSTAMHDGKFEHWGWQRLSPMEANTDTSKAAEFTVFVDFR